MTLFNEDISGPVSNRLADRPGLAESICDLLRDRITSLSPPAANQAPLEPERLALGTSLWRTSQGEQRFEGYDVRSLTDAVIQRFLTGAPLRLSPKDSFATDALGSEHPPHLELDLASIAQEVDLAAAFMLQAWSDRLAAYWGQADEQGQSPWAWLAGYLREWVTRVTRGAQGDGHLRPADASLIAAAVGLNVATPSTPVSLANTPGRVYIIVQPGQALPFLLITGSQAGSVWLVYTLTAGWQRFDSEQALQEGWGQPLPPLLTRDVAKGDVFAQWAAAILDSYLSGLKDRADHLRQLQVSPAAFLAAMEAFPAALLLDRSHRLDRSNAVRKQLPAWLTDATDTDQLRYALGLRRVLGAQMSRQAVPLFSDIPTVEAYTRSRLIAKVALDHPDAPLDPDDVAVRIYQRADDDLLSLAGGSAHIPLQEQQISLVELCLLNTAGRPTGWMHVTAIDGKVVPAWLNDNTAIELVKALDIGATYLALLKERFTQGASGVGRRATFKALVSAQLPLLALELKLQGISGFDERGVSLVQRVFAADAPARIPVTSQLALSAGNDIPPDLVTGMFVLYEPGIDTLVLYAPLDRVRLRQFASPAQLMDAIVEDDALQRSVLFGLTDTAQRRYRNGGLQTPRWLRFGQGDEFAPRPTVTQVTVRPVRLPGAPLDHFYDGMVQALTLAADRQTVSNQESLWISVAEISWLLFNQVLPFLSGPAATAGWLVQLAHSLETHANQVGAPPPEAISNTELMLDVMLAVLSEGTSRVFTAGARKGAVGHPAQSAWHAPENTQALDARWAAPEATITHRLRERLQALSVHLPFDAPPAVPSGPFAGLVNVKQRWLAQVQSFVFEVDPGEGEALVLDPDTGREAGPWLRRDELGRWRLDLRLRLRGGGPKRRIEQQREINRQRRARAGECLASIEHNYRELRSAGTLAEAAIKEAVEGSDVERVRTLRTAELRRAEDAFNASVRWREEYETIAQGLALPEHGLARSTALAAEINLCMYYLSVSRDLLLDMLQRNQILAPGLKADALMTREHVTAWFSFLHTYIDIAEAALAWRLRLDERFALLGDIPVSGPAKQAALQPKAATFRNATEYRALCVYTELSLIEEPMVSDDSVRRSFHDAMKPLVIGMTTHKEVTLDPTLVEHGGEELLDSVVTTYQTAEDTLHWLKQTLAPAYLTPSMDRLLVHIAVLRKDAEAWLRRLIQAAPRVPAPVPGVARPAGSGRRLIRTRNRGNIVARVKPLPERPSINVAEITSPLDNTVVARFEQDAASGEWVEQPEPSTRPEPVATAQPNTERLAQDADRLLAGANRQLQQAPRLAKATHIPMELEELMRGAARDLQALAERIEHSLTLVNETDVALAGRQSAERKAGALREMALRLETEGRVLRIRLTKGALPTAARVRYLVDQGEARIERLGARVALKGPGKRRDLVQEYVVKERDGTVLWYAHFHYPSMDTADAGYVAAHLKTTSQRFVGLSSQMAQAASDTEVVKIYRSRIDPSTARELFLNQQ